MNVKSYGGGPLGFLSTKQSGAAGWQRRLGAIKAPGLGLSIYGRSVSSLFRRERKVLGIRQTLVLALCVAGVLAGMRSFGAIAL